MANADPPDEVDDGQSPPHRDIHAPDADARDEQMTDGEKEQHHQAKGQAKAKPPAPRRRLRERDRANLVGDGAKRVPGTKDGRSLVRRSRLIAWFTLIHALASVKRWHIEVRILQRRQISGA